MPDDIFRIRRDNTTNWTNQDPTLGLGEIGYDTTLKKLKVGTGSAAWTVLDFVTAGITNGTYGDIVVSGGGSTWNLSFALMTTINSKLNSGPLNGGTPAAAVQVMQLRRGTAWTGVVLNAGEMGYDTAANEIRVGDGSTSWAGLNPIGLPKISSFTLNDLGDVTIVSPTAGQVVTWNGSAFVNQSIPAPSLSLDNLTDVVLSAPTNTQVLQYNGSNWVNATVGGSGPVSDGTKGDIQVSGSGSTWTVRNATITYAKMQNVSANKILGSAAGGVVSEIDCTAAGRALLDDATAADQRTTLGAAAAVHTHSISDVTNLQTSLDNKVDDSQISAFGLTLIDDADSATARTTLGLGTIATQNANNIAVTGGTLQGVTAITGTYSSPVNQGLLYAVRKSTAGTISKGRPVYIVGSTGSHLTVELARADVEATSAYTIGVAATDITNGADGFIMLKGRLTGLNNLPTSTFADGDPIYLSESTAGGFRTTLPTAPNHGVFIGFVVKANNGSAGEMDVHIQNYQELEELSDVNISGIAADHFLKRNTANTRWENVSPANARTGLGLGTTDSPQFAKVSLENGEFIENTIDGDVHIMPAPSNSNFVGLRFQFNWAFDTVRIGTKRSLTGTNDDGRVQWLVPLQIFDNTNMIFGDSSRSAIRQAKNASRPQTMQVGVNLVGTGATQDHSNHAFVVCHYGHLGNVNRMPTTLYSDPSLLVYSLDDAQPNDFARLTHDQTDGLLESGNGKMRLKGASVVRIEGPSGGFDLPATAGSNGQVLTTDGTNASWQTPTGGGGGVDEDFVIAMAIALG